MHTILHQLYKFVLASHSCTAQVMVEQHTTLSHKGSQQGYPLSTVEIYDIIHFTYQSVMPEQNLDTSNSNDKFISKPPMLKASSVFEHIKMQSHLFKF